MAGSRGVSKGLVGVVVAVVLLVAVVGGWFWLRQRADSQVASAHDGCVEGASGLAVTVDPDIAVEVKAAADRYNATKPIVRDHCVTVTVTSQPSAAVVAAFTSGGWDQKLGTQPALWIPDSSRSIEMMRVPGLVQGSPLPVAVSPIVLAVPDQLRQALDAAKISWSDLPRLQQGSLSEIGLSGWGGLRMAMPAGDGSLAAALAVGSAVSGSDPLTDDTAHAGQVTSAISRLAAGAPQVADSSSALTTPVGVTAANAAVHATAATEQAVQSGTGLTAYHPIGAAPVADHPAALLTGAWVDKTQNLVAGLFADYLRAPDQQKLFTDAGFAALPAAPPPVTAKSVLDQVHSVLAKPVLGVQATVLVDTSAAMAVKDGTLTRLGNTLGALQSTMDVMPADFGLGVWTYSDLAADDGDSSATAYQVQGATGPLTPAHRTELAKSLSTVSPDEVKTDRAYTTLEAAYKNAVKNYADGHTNTILLITGGPNDDSTVSGTQLLSDIAGLTDPAHPVRIDVIVVGGKGSPTLQTLAQQSNGSYTRLTTSDDLKFGSAISQALTTS
ncbi:substrate-binding domain-containing protein [Nocardia sp. alder85J]|uniref:substrate-binding domain-containing protein n=1 Tax=Nocardia sp. alder85J TaxID=2862949 RepID=UPI001CD5D417|nr:substrate-binding domain-containing protein [Nocardia sp. alder85J]MCX4092650.1 substrate-binding domain-containing protein [Nocardia sp. alder85J]